ncbi:MAG: MBL fold metallo-hydrolase [Firmicutes bacterium]|nr:MBL fold metallo-hydrolase [Candidatus Colivicinus equi]
MKKNSISLEVIGGNAESVTGSCTKITTKEHVYLFELGMMQDGHTPLENYHLNSKMLQKIKPQEIDYIMIGHLHQDHIGLIPALYERGKCNAKIIVPRGSLSILKEMWLDSSYINQRDCEIINLKGKNYEPFYTEKTVMQVLNYVEEIESGEIIPISDELSIRYKNAGHIFLSRQAEVYVKCGSHTKKILFTSDLGNLNTLENRVFVEPFEPVTNCNIVIGECTYSARGREINKKTLKLDIEKIKTVVDQYCVDNNHRVLIPSFSLDRTPYILWILYNLYGKDDSFNVPILIDSPLANRLLDCYSSTLEGDAKEKFDDMMSWKNIKRIITSEDSKAAITEKGARVILSSSGMLTAGRSVKWVQNILSCAEDIILFIGYCAEGTLAHKIQHEKEQKTININGKPYKNKCQIVSLGSFSSHMQRSDLINYYKSINCEKIYLVHSDKDSKIEFKHDLEEAISNCSKSTKVTCVNKGTKISL